MASVIVANKLAVAHPTVMRTSKFELDCFFVSQRRDRSPRIDVYDALAVLRHAINFCRLSFRRELFIGRASWTAVFIGSVYPAWG